MSSLTHQPGLKSPFAIAWIVLCVGGLGYAAIDIGPHLTDWVLGSAEGGDLARIEQVISACSRFLATTLSMLVALCALALPLTANVYTPRLIELFLADRLNRIVLVYFVAANAVVLWNAFMVSSVDPASAHRRAFLSVTVTIGAILVIAPYFLYVLRFLLPQTIVSRLGREVRHDFQSLIKGRPNALQEVVTNIQYIGKVTLRSVQRHDRDVASEGLNALEELFSSYQAIKRDVPKADLPTATRDALGLGPELAQEVVRKDAVVEVAILQELSLLVPLAMSAGVGEVVSQIAALTRRCGVIVAKNDDDRVEELITLYFNTFLRHALKARSAESFYKICYQYRRYATDLLELDTALAERITFYLDYYAHQAARMGMPYLINVVSYDLAALSHEAYLRSVPGKGRFLDAFIALDRDQPGILDLPGVVKSQIILAAQLRTRGEQAASDQLVIELRKVDKEVLRQTFSEIVAARDQETFWEIADRRHHLDHVPPEYRPAIGQLRDTLLPSQTHGLETLMFLDKGAPPPEERRARVNPFETSVQLPEPGPSRATKRIETAPAPRPAGETSAAPEARAEPLPSEEAPKTSEGASSPS